MLVSVPTGRDINHGLLTFTACVYKPVFQEVEHYRREAVWFSLYQTSPRHIEMSRWKHRGRVRWCRRLQRREIPDETGHKGDTRPHSRLWLIGPSRRCSPNFYSNDTIVAAHSWTHFSIIAFIKPIDLMWKPYLTCGSTFSCLFHHCVAQFWVSKKKPKTKHRNKTKPAHTSGEFTTN